MPDTELTIEHASLFGVLRYLLEENHPLASGEPLAVMRRELVDAGMRVSFVGVKPKSRAACEDQSHRARMLSLNGGDRSLSDSAIDPHVEPCHCMERTFEKRQTCENTTWDGTDGERSNE
jgi:hypothetical protein